MKSAVPTPKRPYWLVDRFDGDAIDLESWHVATNGLVDDAGVEFVERDGRLQVTVSQDVAFAGNGFDKHLGTQCMLLGDFDARVEYGLLDWPADDGMYLTFGAFFHWTNGWSFVARAGRGLNGGFDSYTAQIAQTPRVLQTNDSSGALRLKRRRGVMTAYVRHSGQWFELNSARRPGSVNLIIGFSSNRDQFGHSAATVSLDNFEATADSVDCAGFPVPPRKPRS